MGNKMTRYQIMFVLTVTNDVNLDEWELNNHKLFTNYQTSIHSYNIEINILTDSSELFYLLCKELRIQIKA